MRPSGRNLPNKLIHTPNVQNQFAYLDKLEGEEFNASTKSYITYNKASSCYKSNICTSKQTSMESKISSKTIKSSSFKYKFPADVTSSQSHVKMANKCEQQCKVKNEHHKQTL